MKTKLNNTIIPLLLIFLGISLPSDCQRPFPSVIELPEINITYQETINSKKKIHAEITIDVDSLSGLIDFQGYCGIEFHGNSTLNAPKKSYDIELRDAEGNELTRQLLDFGAEEDFILLAQYFDKSHYRNALAFNLWSRMGHYSPKYRHVKLNVNGEFQGTYLLVEKIKVDKNRLDLDIGTADDWAVGDPFLVKFDNENPNYSSWPQNFQGENITIKTIYPKNSYDDGYHLQFEFPYITDKLDEAIDNVSKGLRGKDHYHYRDFIDVASFVDYFLMTELSKNPDGFKRSVYFYRDRVSQDNSTLSKIHMGPVWDFDLAFGNVNYGNYKSAEGWTYLQKRDSKNVDLFPAFWYKLLCDPEFVQQCISRLQEIKEMATKSNLEREAATLFHHIEQSMKLDTERWRGKTNQKAKPSAKGDWNQISDVLDFYWRRLEWMEENLKYIRCIPPSSMYYELEYLQEIAPDLTSKRFVVPAIEHNPKVDTTEWYSYPQYYTYRLLNSSGEVLLKGPSSDTIYISYENLSPGDYYLEVFENDENAPAISAVIESYYMMTKLTVPK
ncbi:MAG: CotH kinase family protein [Crocinitomicaceae bacterium]